MNLLGLPAEIRLQILCHLLANKTIKVEAELRGDQLENNEVWAMKHSGCLHPAVLCVCLQLFLEGQSLVYTDNVFDCSQREGTILLLKCIGSENFVQIKHLILEWDQLQDLAWALAKEPGGSYFAGLESVLMATWRTRILGGKSLVWLQNKNYERQLCYAAINILEKHPKLVSLLQIPYKKGKMNSVHSNNNYRVKWRFIAVEQTMRAGETVVDLESELEQLRVKVGEDSGEPVQQMMDPF
jgi:hypothetical protein